MTEVQPGWHPDPWDADSLRWWDGSSWSHHTQPVPPAAATTPVAGLWSQLPPGPLPAAARPATGPVRVPGGPALSPANGLVQSRTVAPASPAGSPVPSPAAPAPRAAIGVALLISLAGSALAGLGSLLPWATLRTPFGTTSVPGLEGGGWYSLLFSLIGAGALLAMGFQRNRALVVTMGVAALVGTGLSLLVGLGNAADLTAAADQVFLGEVGIGVGLVLVMVGSAVAGAAGLVAFITALARPR